MTDHAVSSEAPDPHRLVFAVLTRAPALGLTTDRPEGSRRGYWATDFCGIL